MAYNSAYTGSQIDEAIASVRGKAWAGTQFTVTLPASGWSNGSQTVNNPLLISNGYAYTVSAAPASYIEATLCGVRAAEDVTEDGKIVFSATETPTVDLYVNILRTEANDG